MEKIKKKEALELEKVKKMKENKIK